MNSWLSQNLVECLGWTLVHFIWQGLGIAAVLAVALRVMRSAAANSRYLAGCLALLLMAFAPVVTFHHLAGRLSVETPARFETAVAPRADAGPDLSAVQSRFVVLGKTIKDARSLAEHVERMFPWLVLGWSLGVLAFSVRLLGGWVQIYRLRRVGISAVPSEWHDKLTFFAEKLGFHRPVRLVQSALVEAPVMLGWLRPMILLPASCLTGLTPAQLESILAHELAHIRRHDYLVNLLQSLLETILFYHPVVWWVSRRVREEREHCCDDLAVEVCGDRAVYARALATLEELRLPASLALGASGPTLLSRIRRLAGQSPSQAQRPAWPLAGIIALMLIVAMAMGLRGNRAVAQENQSASTNSRPRTVTTVDRLQKIVKPSSRHQQMMSKLDKIEFDSVHFEHLAFPDVINFLAEFTKEADPDHVGINFFVNQAAPPGAEIDPQTGLPNPVRISDVNVTIQPPLRHVRLTDVLDAITKTADHPIGYSILDYAVEFHLLNPNEPALETRAFHVDPNTFRQGLESIQGNAFGNSLPGSMTPQTQNGTNITPGDIRQFLSALGMDMNTNNPANAGKTFVWNDRKGLLILRSSAADLSAVETALMALSNAPDKPEAPSSFQPQLHQKDDENKNAPAVPKNAAPQTNSAREVNIKAKYVELDNPPTNFAGLYHGNSSTTEGAVTCLLTWQQFKAAVEALEHRNDADEFNAPEITTETGRLAQMSVSGNNTPPPKEPEAMQKWLGAQDHVLDVVPSVGSDGWSVELALTSTSKEWGVINNLSAEPRQAVGDFVDKGSPGGVIATPTAAGAPEVQVGLSSASASPLPQMIKVLKRVSAKVKVWDGQTVMLAGMTSAERNSHNNKYVLLFVTPTLINPNGTRVHSDADVLTRMKLAQAEK